MTTILRYSMKPRLKLLVLRCADIMKTKDFYTKLGLNFVEEQHGNSPIHYSCNVDGVVIELYPASQSFPVDSCRLGFSCSNFTELSEFMCANIEHRNGNDFFVVIDSDGRKVEITK